MKMNPEIKARWVAALRSGEYKQGKGTLRSGGDEFCCLGVLCNLHAQEHPEIAVLETNPREYMGGYYLPSDEVTEWAGLSVGADVFIGRRKAPLYKHNDAGRTFAQIAKAIEEQL